MEDTYVKEESKLEVCRLCLDFITDDGDVYFLDSVAKNILEDVIPQLNLDLSHEPKICRSCHKNMLACYEFKYICDNCESIDTKIKIEESTEIYIELQANGRKCGFCTNSIDEIEEIRLRKEFYNLQKSLASCLPSWIRGRSTNVPCKNCLETLENLYTFHSVCLNTEEKMKNYYLSEGSDSQGKIDLYKVLHFVLSNKNDAISCKFSLDNKSSVLPENSVHVKTERDDCLTIKTEDIEIKSEEISEECMKTFYIEQEGKLEEIEVPSTSQEEFSNEVFGFYKTSCFKACLVPNCVNNTLITPDKIVLTVPKDHRREGWCNAIEKGIGERLYWQETTNYYVCEDHFNLKEDMRDYVYPYKLINGKIFLKAGVVPHVFKCLDSKKRKSVEPEIRNMEPKQPKISFEQQNLSQNCVPGKRSIGIQVNLDLLGKLSVGTQVDSIIETRTIGVEASADMLNASTSTTQLAVSKGKYRLRKRKTYKVRK